MISRRPPLLALRLHVVLMAFLPYLSFAGDDKAPSDGQDDHNRSVHAAVAPDHFGDLDHPLWKGQIAEEEVEERLRQFEADWDKIDFRKGEGAAVFRRYLDSLGVERIVHLFESKNPFCHGELHDLGSLLLERTGNLAVSLALCDDACTYSCTHGVLRRYFSGHTSNHPGGHDHAKMAGEYDHVNIDTVRPEIIELCSRDSTIIRGFLRGNCAHAIGHAFGIISNGSVKMAQGHCGIFVEPAMQYYCETGVFMEYEHSLSKEFNEGLKTTVAGWLSRVTGGRLSAAVHYCSAKTRFVSACVRYFVKVLRNDEDIEQFADSCLELSDIGRRSCFFAMGFAGVSYVASNPAEINKLCGFGDRVDQELCISGFAFLKEGHDRKEAVVRACGNVVPASLKAVCVGQTRLSYYQVDNPVFDEMLSGKLQQGIGAG